MRTLRKVLLTALFLTSCSPQQNYEPYREKIRAELRDPASAEFRSEKIRTLWSSGGRRVRLYCAEVNANNAFGGKSGFKPVTYIISAKNARVYDSALASDPVWIHGEVNSNYYLDCVRPDTQRSDENFGKAIPDFGEFDQAEADRLEPVLSNETAPEER